MTAFAPDLSDARPYDFKAGQGTTLLIACGALGREVVTLIEIGSSREAGN